MKKQDTLGEILAARLEKEKNDKIAFLERQAKEKSEKEERNLETLKHCFEQIKKDICEQILSGKDIKITIGRGSADKYPEIDKICNEKSSSLVLSDEKHYYYPIWSNFDSWAKEQDLKVDLVYEHDGMGIQSWHALIVCPEPEVVLQAKEKNKKTSTFKVR